MNALASSAGDIFVNGGLLPGLWRADEIECPLGGRTFAASRWAVRYASPAGGIIRQRRGLADGGEVAGAGCLILDRVGAAVSETVFFGQRIAAEEAARYRSRLAFSAWVFIAGAGDATVELHVGSARSADCFGGAAAEGVEQHLRERLSIPRGRWSRLACPLDAGAFPATGLSVELAFSPELLSGEVRVAQLRLEPAGGAPAAARPAALEAYLAERYFQRHDSFRLNSIGRALVVNAHELHFQFTFPELRADPAITLPHSEEGLRLFDLEGLPQNGFRYDVTYRARSSAIIRATRARHGLRDGFLSFVGRRAAIFLDAEP